MSGRSSWTLFVIFVFGNAILLRTYVTNNADIVQGVNSDTDNDVDDVMNQWRFVKSRQILDFREKEEFVLSRRRRRRSVVEDDETSSSPWIDCEALTQARQERQFLAAGWTKAVYRARHGGRDVAIKQVNLNGHDAVACLKEGQSPWECYRRSAAKIMKEIILLRELAHPNVLKILGFCIPDGSSDNGGGGGGLSLITELGESLDIIQLLQRSWEDRLRVVLGVGRLVHHLSHSPLGSLVMNDFRRQQFVLTNGELKLSDVDDMELDEPSCDAQSSSVCVSHHEAAELTFTVPCGASGRCRGYNEKQNIFHAGRHFVSFLLPHGAPWSLRPRVDAVVTAFANVTWDSERLLRELEEIHRLFVSGEYLDRRAADDDGRDVLQKGFRRFEDSEIPVGFHDYRCQLTVSGNGCMLSVHDDLEAMDICRSDRDCAAFVVSPQRSWTGRHVTHFKNHFPGSPVKAFGSTLYVKTDLLESSHGHYQSNSVFT